MIIALDPGNTHTAGVYLGTDFRQSGGGYALSDHWYLPNAEAIDKITTYPHCDHMAVEMIACYGMAVGREVFDTCVWIGRFIERWNGPHTQVFRRDVKLHLCNSAKAKDKNVRQALLDLYGGKGATKKGAMLHGVTGDVWAALGVGTTYLDTKQVRT